MDGDSLTIDGTRVRLFGIDAPEAGQTCHRAGVAWACGDAATRELRALISDQTVHCRGKGTDSYGRTLAVCFVRDVELNRTLVEYGWAMAFREYSQDYVAVETLAQARKLGIWSSVFMTPSDYRASKARANTPARSGSPALAAASRATAPETTGTGCLIKGNRNRKGQWIYHLPGMPYYGPTRAEEWFCTEAQARAAGYRRAIVR